MKRNLVFGLAIVLFAFVSCKEKHNLVSLSSITSTDTTYVLPASAIPPADPHNVLVEDFTGVTCSNCPGAHDMYLVPIIAANPGKVNLIEMFVTDFPQTMPNAGQLYGGFRDTVATTIESGVFGALVLMPIAGIDRMPLGVDGTNNTQVKKGTWTTAIDGRLTTTDSINLLVSSTYDSATRNAVIIAKITYLQNVSTPQNLSIAVVEDGFIDLQEFPDSVAMYHYDDVFRDLVTPAPFGDPIYPAIPSKEAGRVCQKAYTYHLNAAWNPAHCRLIAFVHGNGTVAGQYVAQSWQAPLSH